MGKTDLAGLALWSRDQDLWCVQLPRPNGLFGSMAPVGCSGRQARWVWWFCWAQWNNLIELGPVVLLGPVGLVWSSGFVGSSGFSFVALGSTG